MYKKFMILVFLAAGMASLGVRAQEKIGTPFDPPECPDRCSSDAIVCCDTPGGGTYFGVIRND